MSEIMVMGAIRGNVTAKISQQMAVGQQNPGKIAFSYSGTGRNIAENLGRMGADAALAAVAGDDAAGKSAKIQLEALGVNTQFVKLLEGQDTAMNIAVLNIVGDLEYALDNGEVHGFMDKDLAAAAMRGFRDAKIICADGSLPEETLTYLVETSKTPLFFDPHTEEDAKKAKAFVGKFDTIKPNRAEASILCGMDIFSEEQLMAAGQWFADQGVRRIFITLSGGGVYYKEGFDEGILRPGQVLTFADESGAGDAFSAAILDGTVRGMRIEELAAYGMKAAAIALESETAVNPLMSRQRLEQEPSPQSEALEKGRM